MNKHDIILDLRRFTGGASFIRRKDLARYLGRADPHSIDKYIKPLTKIDGLYFINDVAEQLLQGR